MSISDITCALSVSQRRWNSDECRLLQFITVIIVHTPVAVILTITDWLISYMKAKFEYENQRSFVRHRRMSIMTEDENKSECVYCGAVDGEEQTYYDIYVRNITHSDGSDKLVCNLCIPNLETVQ